MNSKSEGEQLAKSVSGALPVYNGTHGPLSVTTTITIPNIYHVQATLCKITH